MTIERDPDPDATMKMPQPMSPGEDLEYIDPEQTLVRDDLVDKDENLGDEDEDSADEDWESTVIRRVAPRVAAVRSEVEDRDDEPFGWESEVLRRLSRELRREL